MHDINVKTYRTHETKTLPLTDHMTNEKEHQAVRRLLEAVKDGSLAKRSVAKVYSGALVE